MECLIYKHTFPNGKVYFGYTSYKNPKRRWGTNGDGYKNQPVYDAIEHFGWDNIKHEIIAKGIPTIAEAKAWETKLINEYHSNDIHFGYNFTPGGDSISTELMWTDEENALLTQVYPTIKNTELPALFPKRSKQAIVTHATRDLQLRKIDTWTDLEIEILKQNFTELGVENIAKLLPNRTTAAINSKACHLGLSYTRGRKYKYASTDWSCMEDALLLECFYNYGLDYLSKVQPKLNKKAKTHIRSRLLMLLRKTIELKKRGEKWTTEEDLLLLQNCDSAVTIADLAILLPARSAAAIRNRLVRLGLHIREQK